MNILVLLGKSASGKDTIAKHILAKHSEFKKAVSHTTRPIRSGEVEGIDYHYVSDEVFDSMKDSFIEQTSYNVNGELWRYGFSKEEFKEDGNYLVILNPRGLEAFLKSDLKKYVKILYVSCKETERVIRYFVRDNGGTNLINLGKQCRDRIKQDKLDFEVDYISSLLNQTVYDSIDTTDGLNEEELDKSLFKLIK